MANKIIAEIHEEERDEEKAFLGNEQQPEHVAYPQKALPAGLSRRFWFAAVLNCLSTAGIVSVF